MPRLPSGAKGKRLKTKALSVFVVILFLAQSTGAPSYPLTIAPGRSWPLSVVADSARGLVYFDTTSGEYPPIGFSFGIINATTHEVIKVLPLDAYPGPLALDQRSGNVYVAGSTAVAVLDGSNQTFGRQINVGHPLRSIAFDSSVSQNVFVTSGNRVFSLDPETGALAGNATFADDVDGIVLNPSNGRLYVGQYPDGKISVLQASNLAPVGDIQLPGCCALQFALDSGTQTLYAATGTNYVYVVNAATDSFVKSLSVAQSGQNSTNAIAVDSTTGMVFVATSPGGGIVELDGSDGVIVRVLKVQSQVAGLALDAKTHELYATNYHQLTVFDAREGGGLPIVLFLPVAVVAAAAIGVYALIRRRNERGRGGAQRPAAGDGPG